MLDVLGLDPLDPRWAQAETAGETGGGEHRALDALVRGRLAERAEARAAKDWARADAIRDELTAAGLVIEDGREGASWSLGSTTTTTGGN